jgi:hypothetical protein
MGALKIVLALKFYNSFLLVRADPAGASSTTPHYLAQTIVDTQLELRNVTAPIKDDILFTIDLLFLAMAIK